MSPDPTDPATDPAVAEPAPDEYPVLFGGERFYRGRTRVSGTVDAPTPLARHQQVAVLHVGTVEEVSFGTFAKAPAVQYGLHVIEAYEVPMSQVADVLEAARTEQRRREDQAQGVQPLWDDLQDERAEQQQQADAEPEPEPEAPADEGTPPEKVTAAELRVLRAVAANPQVHPSNTTDEDGGTVHSRTLGNLEARGLVQLAGDRGVLLTTAGRNAVVAADPEWLRDAADLADGPDDGPDDLPEGVSRLGRR